MKALHHILATSLLVALHARADTLTIDAVDNIFGAGHTTAPGPSGGGGGTLPPSFSFTAGFAQTITFTNITGSVIYFQGAGSQPCDPDGNPFNEVRDVSSFGGISGIITPTRFSLLGVFLTDSEPLDLAPSRLDFTAGSGIAFTTLSPTIGQTFFIGDGLTGTGTGAIQQFQVPATATRVFLGFADTHGDPGDGAGSFFDNTGSFTATATVVPEPSSALLLLSGAALCLRRRSLRAPLSPKRATL